MKPRRNKHGKQALRNDGTPHRHPEVPPQYRSRMTRSVLTLHHNMAKALYREVERFYAGRYVWNPILFKALVQLEAERETGHS